MLDLLYATAFLLGMFCILWYGILALACCIKATILAVSFYRWSTTGIKLEGCKQKWWRKFYIIPMWADFLSWSNGRNSITTSYGKFSWWNDKCYCAKCFCEQGVSE